METRRYITIDGGTTNTRVSLVKNFEIIQTVKINIGAAKSQNGNGELKSAVKSATQALLLNNGLKSSDILRILASGMITSEYGLHNVPHITLPVGVDDLSKNFKQVDLPEISEIPFVFISGVKSIGERLCDNDMMRGEETELAGLCGGEYKEGIYVLPGSHSKIISVDASKRIKEFKTMLTGEMIASLSQNTILKDAVDLSCSEIDEEYLLKGYEYCREYGINDALFKVRILKNILDADVKQRYSFFIGAVLEGEITAIINSGYKNVFIAGKSQIKNALFLLLKGLSDIAVSVVSDADSDAAPSRGMIYVYELG